jgi:hypothetical protein
MTVVRSAKNVRRTLPATLTGGRLAAPALAFVLLALTAATLHSQSAAPSLTATILYPANGAIGVDLSLPIQWTTVQNAQAYYLYVGTTVGEKDLVNTGEIQTTSYSMANLPPGVAYARIWVKAAGEWRYTDSTFTVTPLSYVTYPGNGSIVTDLSQPLRWTTVANAQAYYLYVGSTPGAKDLINTGEIQATSYSIANLPLGVAYARMWVRVAGTWYYRDTSFTVSPNAYLTYPGAGATLVDMSQPFRWNSVPNAQAYYLYVGTTIGARDLVNTGEIQATSTAMPHLPPGVAYARLWVRVAGAWRYTDSSFTVPAISYITYPASGATVTDLSVPLQWTTVAGAQAYYLYVGTTPGAKDLVNTGEVLRTSQSISGLPRGLTVYARLHTKAGNVWRYVDVTFTTSPAVATLTQPNAGASNVDLTKPFTWTAVTGAQAYYLYVGTSIGTNNVVNSGELQQTSYTARSTWTGTPAASVAWDQPTDSPWISGFAMSVDGTRIDLGLPYPVPCSDPADFNWCYRTPLPPMSPGSHQIQVSAYNENGESSGVAATLTTPDSLLYVRLWTKLAGVWYYVDSSFSAATLAAQFISPAFAASNVDVTQPLRWTAVPGADLYSLRIGLAPGGNDLLDVANLQTTSYRAAGLSSLSIDRRVFGRLGTRVQGVWRYTETTFGVMPLATLTIPSNGQIDVPLSTTFYWSAAAVTPQAYYLYVGTSLGAKDIVDSGERLAQSYTATNLPAERTLYARLWTKIAGVWRYVDSQFTTERDPRICPCSLWPLSTTPGRMDPERRAVELGMRFTSSVNGSVTGIRFYKYALNTGPHVGNLWTANGVWLGTVTFTNETESGWQQATLPVPVAITANTTYIVSYHTTTGSYASTIDGFVGGRTRGPLHAEPSGSTFGNGVHRYAETSGFPDQPWYENYWVDLIFMPQ